MMLMFTILVKIIQCYGARAAHIQNSCENNPRLWSQSCAYSQEPKLKLKS